MKLLGQLLSFTSLYTFIFIFQPQIASANEYNLSEQKEVNQERIIKALDRQIAKAQKKKTSMQE